MECIKLINIKLNTVFFVLGSISFYCIWQHGISCSVFFSFPKCQNQNTTLIINMQYTFHKKRGGGIKYAQVTQFCKMYVFGGKNSEHNHFLLKYTTSFHIYLSQTSTTTIIHKQTHQISTFCF